MQEYFSSLGDTLFKQLESGEQLLLEFSGEDSDFVRLNHNKIRQAGFTAQRTLSLDLIEGRRHARASVELAGDSARDLDQLGPMLKTLREQRALLPEDPYLNFSTEINDSEYHHDDAVVDSHEAVGQIIEAGDTMDLVGIFANGIQYRGFANSMGQRNWHSRASFNFDWSCYLQEDRAVKSSYAGFAWQHDELASKMESARHQLAMLSSPSKTLRLGSYRAYLAPSAVSEIISMMAWGGFGLKSHRTKTTPLIQMTEQGRTLDAAVSLTENHARGLAPGFTGDGFIKPAQVELIRAGRYNDCLVSARSAIEYGSAANADSEFPGSLDMAPGALPARDILKELDTGLYINNLWYLNFSDRNACQVTGMTRFACFWVENGQIKAPVEVMRFDDSVYNLLGAQLVGLTKERELILDAGTYGGRSNNSIELPGVLVAELRLTL